VKKLSPFALTWLLCVLTNATVAWHQYNETRHYRRMQEQSEQLLEQGRRLELVAAFEHMGDMLVSVCTSP
jgi:hypothetical protein